MTSAGLELVNDGGGISTVVIVSVTGNHQKILQLFGSKFTFVAVLREF